MAKSPRALPLLEFHASTESNTTSGVQTSSNYKLLTSNFISVLEKVGDHPFAVYCMSGLSRIGKSYMLNIFMQHLRRQSTQPQQDGEFKWRKGMTRETVGINLWSEPFLVKNKKGREIAILLMDGQGLFDEQTTLQQNSVIFAHCCLFSSVCIFNCMKNIDIDTLQNLDFLTQFARAVGHQSDTNGFQKLVIMVRDYDDPFEYGFGHHEKRGAPLNFDGVTRNYYLDKLFDKTRPDISYDKRALIKGISHNFDSIGIVLHPDPGSKFRQNPLANVPDPEFTEKTQEFIQLMLSSDYLVTKTKAGRQISGREFISYVEHCGVLCEKSKDNFPSKLTTVAQSTAMLSNVLARTHAYNVFVEKFTDFLNSNDNMEDTKIHSEYYHLLGEALMKFNRIRKSGDHLMHSRYEEDLRTKCKSKFESLQESYCLRRHLKIVKIESKRQRELHMTKQEELYGNANHRHECSIS